VNSPQTLEASKYRMRRRGCLEASPMPIESSKCMQVPNATAENGDGKNSATKLKEWDQLRTKSSHPTRKSVAGESRWLAPQSKPRCMHATDAAFAFHVHEDDHQLKRFAGVRRSSAKLNFGSITRALPGDGCSSFQTPICASALTRASSRRSS